MHVAFIGGASTIGSTAAYTLVSSGLDIDVSLVDIADEAAWAHAKDIAHADYHFDDSPVPPSGDSSRELNLVQGVGTGTLDEIDPDLVIVTASSPTRDRDSQGDSRRETLSESLPIADDIAGQLRSIDPTPVLVVTNPIDRITYRLWDQLGWPRGAFMGYSLSETARVADRIGQLHDVHPNLVYCPVMGEHGEHIVPVFSRARIEDERIELTDEEAADVIQYGRDIAFDIADRRGKGETSRWVTGSGIARVVRTMMAGGTDEPFCLATPLAGEYGFDDGCLGVPVRLSAEGVEEIIQWDLAADERERLQAAHEGIVADLASI